MSTSSKSSSLYSPKKIIFDAFFYAYSTTIFFFFILFMADVVVERFNFIDSSWWSTSAKTFALAFVGLTVICGFLAPVFYMMGIKTVGGRIFSDQKDRFKKIILDSIHSSVSIIIFFVVLLFLSRYISHSFGFVDQDWAVLNMNKVATCFFALTIASAVVAVLFYKTGVSTLGDYLFSNSTRKQVLAEQGFLNSFYGMHLSLTFIATFILSISVTQASIYELTSPEGFAGATRLFGGLLNANFALLPIAIVEVMETIFIAFMATVIAIPIAFILSFLCAKNIMVHPVAFAVYMTLRTFLNITRSVEPLIWAVIFTVWVGVGPFAGMLSLMIHSIASLAKQYSEIVEGVNDGPIEGIRSTGANVIQTIWFAVVPQVVLPYIAFTIYRWDINVRMATVIGLVGGGGIGTLLIKYQGQAMWPEVGCIIAVIAVVVWIMDTSSAYIREALK